MTAAKYTLRLLRGIAEIEARLVKAYDHPNPLWAKEMEGLDDVVEQASMRLFGITAETVATETQRRFRIGDEDAERWRFALQPFVEAAQAESEDLEASEAAEIALWAAHGWDVTDGEGETLYCLPDFSFQMAVATLGLLGRLPDAERPAEEIQNEAEEWGKTLGKAVRPPRRW